jgi:hypothetical protein
LAIVCRHVLDDGKPISFVCHDADGDWEYLCADENHVNAEDGRLLCHECILERDPTLRGIELLPKGQYAFRKSVGTNVWETGQLE